MKKDNGITLIALVITIIVMLILVMVTVSFAMNGNLFGRAREASTDYRGAQLSEAIAVVKSEIYADYYANELDADEITQSEVETRVQNYLKGSGLETVTVSSFAIDSEEECLKVTFGNIPDGVTVPNGGFVMYIDFIKSL